MNCYDTLDQWGDIHPICTGSPPSHDFILTFAILSCVGIVWFLVKYQRDWAMLKAGIGTGLVAMAFSLGVGVRGWEGLTTGFAMGVGLLFLMVWTNGFENAPTSQTSVDPAAATSPKRRVRHPSAE